MQTDADQEIVALSIQHGIRQGRARGYNLHYVPLDHTLSFFGILHLFANCHLAAHLDQLGDVALHGVVGHAGQGHFARSFAMVAGRQSQTEQLGRSAGVIVEHFVEVTHAKEQYGIPVLIFEVPILLHGRGELSCWHGALWWKRGSRF